MKDSNTRLINNNSEIKLSFNLSPQYDINILHENDKSKFESILRRCYANIEKYISNRGGLILKYDFMLFPIELSFIMKKSSLLSCYRFLDYKYTYDQVKFIESYLLESDDNKSPSPVIINSINISKIIDDYTIPFRYSLVTELNFDSEKDKYKKDYGSSVELVLNNGYTINFIITFNGSIHLLDKINTDRYLDKFGISLNDIIREFKNLYLLNN